MSQMTTSQIDKLGKRLTKEPISDVDLNLLDQYRLSFSVAYEYVVSKLHEAKFNVTGRQTKSTQSIISKRHREKTSLSTMQDIAGCRVVVPDILSQNLAISQLEILFLNSIVKKQDRRVIPTHGYRAVHLVVSYNGRVIEIQVRTALQHLWAEMCEKLSDVFGIEVKYGGGPQDVGDCLVSSATLFSQAENEEFPNPDSKIIGARNRKLIKAVWLSIGGDEDAFSN